MKTLMLFCSALIAAVAGAQAAPAAPPLPRLLSDTALFSPGTTTTLAAGVVPFAPQYPLWSDGTRKRRWIALPPGAAIDAARVSRRLGAEVVQVYRRTRAEMPANAEDVEAAVEEGVRQEFLAAPLRIEPGRLQCIRMALGEPDADGRRRPQAMPGTEFDIEADTVILAVGQLASAPETAATRQSNGTIRARPDDLCTSVPGLFAGGDAVTGPSSIIVAIAQGRTAAAAIDRHLGGRG